MTDHEDEAATLRVELALAKAKIRRYRRDIRRYRRDIHGLQSRLADDTRFQRAVYAVAAAMWALVVSIVALAVWASLP